MSKYEVVSGPCFPAFSPNTGKYDPEISPCLDTFQAVFISEFDQADASLEFITNYFQYYHWLMKQNNILVSTATTFDRRHISVQQRPVWQSVNSFMTEAVII